MSIGHAISRIIVEHSHTTAARFDLLRDATTVAAFLCADTVVSCCGAFLIVASTVLANLIVCPTCDRREISI